MTLCFLSSLVNYPPPISTFMITSNSLNSLTRSSEHSKLLHITSTSNTSRHFYFCRLPRLWNALPHIDLNLPLPIIKYKLYQYFWQHFISNFNSNSVCTFHFLCPCSKCIANPRAPIKSPVIITVH